MHEGHHHHDREPAGDSPQMRKALLFYLLGHNRSHAKELTDLADRLEAAKDAGAAAAVREGAALFDRGNAELERALALLEDC